MSRLLQLIYRYRAFFTFLILELLSAWFIVRNNRYQSAAFFTTSNSIVASVVSFSNSVSDYFSLQEQNKILSQQNAFLRDQLEIARTSQIELDSTRLLPELDQYRFVTAAVINNSTRRSRNYLTIDKGLNDGLAPGMGVISGSDIVGMVKYSSDHYSVVTSLLHMDFMVSSSIPDKVDLCTTVWDGSSPLTASVEFIPRHISLLVGDTIVTSGFGGIFPEGVLIGRILESSLEENEAFHNVTIQLETEFSQLSFVQVIQNRLKVEKDSLELNVEL